MPSHTHTTTLYSALILCLAAGCGSPPPPAHTADAGPEIDAFYPGDPGPTDRYLFDPDEFHEFNIELPAQDWQALRDDALLEEYVPATMIFEGKRYDQAAIRFKGDWNSLITCFEDGEQVCPKLSIKVSFNEYVPGRFAGQRKLVFNSSVRDRSLMREVVSYWIFREMGIPAPRATHARLTVNGEWQGVFVLVENIDKEFIEEHWILDHGNLYKSVWPQHDDPGEYAESLRTNEDTPDVSGMLAFKELLESTSSDTFTEDVAGTLDLSYMARFMAVDQAIGNTDGARRFYCYDDPDWQECENNNYYWYQEPGRLFHLLPWDLDYAWRDPNTDLGRSMWSDDCTPIPACEFYGDSDCDPTTEDIAILPAQCDPLLGHVHRATWSSYLDTLEELAGGPMALDRLMPFVDAQRAKIREAVMADPYGPSPAQFDESSEWLDELFQLQLAEIEQLLTEQRQ